MLYFQRWKIVSSCSSCWSASVRPSQLLLRRDACFLADLLPQRQIVLGLDLQGGSHLLLRGRIATSLIKDGEKLDGDIRQTLRDERIGYRRPRRARRGRSPSRCAIRPTPTRRMQALQPLATAGADRRSSAGGTVSEVDDQPQERRPHHRHADRRRASRSACARAVTQSIEVIDAASTNSARPSRPSSAQGNRPHPGPGAGLRGHRRSSRTSSARPRA